MKKEIRQAFDQVHAPDALVERLKQELYQKDFYEDADEVTWQVEEAPRRQFGKYFAYIAATLMLCVGCGMAVWSLNTVEIQPGSQVSNVSPVQETEPTTEETTEFHFE